LFLSETNSFGANPEVFYYKIYDDRPKVFVVLMTFYSAISVAVTLTENNKINNVYM